MPTRDPRDALSVERALEIAGRIAFGDAKDPGGRAVGLEQERFLVETDRAGRPLRRLPLAGADGVVDAVLAHARAGGSPFIAPDGGYPPVFELEGGGTLTFEPGAQIEHSTAVHAGATAALDDLARVTAELERVFRGRPVKLVALGIDPWHGPADVAQQLDAPRYRCMDAYFARRGPAGAYMMRLSCSLQVNLDLGIGSVRDERWRLANLVGPWLTALFTTSPGAMDGARWASRRARVWQTIDPTRAGLPRAFLEHPDWSPERQYAEAVLDADLMLIRTDGDAETGRPGRRFRDWIRAGDHVHGRPTEDDLRYHMTTLFFDVRPRGFLEIRGVDALPYCFRPAPVAFLTGLLYDDRARGAALELLVPGLARAPELHVRAARHGLADEEIAQLGRRLWRIALDGAQRLGDTFMAQRHFAAAAAYGERFVERGRAPGDELAAACADGPEVALAWAMSTGCGRAESEERVTLAATSERRS